MPDVLDRIFLLSHMRAFTSLAGHILGSHPEIDGYYEMHLAYEDAGALERQLAMYCEADEIKGGSRYLFDKILHNDYPLHPDRLGDVGVKLLVSLLEPGQAIRSIVDLFAVKGMDDPYASPDGAAEYYISRLEALAGFCERSSTPFFFFDAELFQRDPETLLAKLGAWLALETPLSERYQVFSHTGKPRKGDTSALIHHGRIDRTPIDYSHIEIPEAILSRAEKTYLDCRARMIQRAADTACLE